MGGWVGVFVCVCGGVCVRGRGRVRVRVYVHRKKLEAILAEALCYYEDKFHD